MSDQNPPIEPPPSSVNAKAPSSLCVCVSLPFPTPMGLSWLENDEWQQDREGGKRYIKRHHKHELLKDQCSFVLVKHIKAPFHIIMKMIIIRPDESHRRNFQVFLHGFFPNDNPVWTFDVEALSLLL